MQMSGYFTTYGGQERRVAGRFDQDTIELTVEGDGTTRGREVVAASSVGRIVLVHVTAQWRGGKVIVSDEDEPGKIGFYTWDSNLAEREALWGDQYNGWSGEAAVEELTDVVEDVKVLREAGGGDGA